MTKARFIPLMLCWLQATPHDADNGSDSHEGQVTRPAREAIQAVDAGYDWTAARPRFRLGQRGIARRFNGRDDLKNKPQSFLTEANVILNRQMLFAEQISFTLLCPLGFLGLLLRKIWVSRP